MKGHHRTRRSAALATLAKNHGIPESTVVGRGLHRKPRATRVAPTAQSDHQEATRKALLAQPLRELGLGARAYGPLWEESINTIGELVGMTEKDLLGVPGIGTKTINGPGGIKEKLAAQTPPLYLKGDEPAAT